MLDRTEASIRSPMAHVFTRRLLIWGTAAALFALSLGLVAFAHHPARSDPRLLFPRIQAAGGVLEVGPDAMMPSTDRVHRLLVDVDDDAAGPEGINERLKTAAKILNLYALAGVPPQKVRMVLLFYGRGVRLALSDAAYRTRFHQANPDARVLAQLRRANVQMVACGQALGHQTFTAADLSPGVQLALSALTAREEFQARGYGSVPREAP